MGACGHTSKLLSQRLTCNVMRVTRGADIKIPVTALGAETNEASQTIGGTRRRNSQ